MGYLSISLQILPAFAHDMTSKGGMNERGCSIDLQCEGRDDWLYGDFSGFFNPLPSVLNRDPSAGDGSHLNKANMTSKATYTIRTDRPTNKIGRLTWKNKRLFENSLERNTFSGINLQFTVHSYKNCREKLNAEVKYPLLSSGVEMMNGYDNASWTSVFASLFSAQFDMVIKQCKDVPESRRWLLSIRAYPLSLLSGIELPMHPVGRGGCSFWLLMPDYHQLILDPVTTSSPHEESSTRLTRRV